MSGRIQWRCTQPPGFARTDSRGRLSPMSLLASVYNR